MCDFEPLNWSRKYKSMKNKYKELYFLRYTSIEEDIKVIEARIDEHKRVHDETKDDIKDHKNMIEQAIEDRLSLKHRLVAMTQKIDELRREIRYRDYILAQIIEHYKVRAVVISQNKYFVHSTDEKVQFTLIREDSGLIRYIPEKIPFNAPLDMRKSEFVFKSNDLELFLQRVDDLIE